ncbi:MULTISPECIES: tRNA pseudouridine(13) synthase TruD [Tatumella]|uniref:tRNA pseudouridine synthase D n=1 Tax=Tatumella punctata TaxID=399969 RepID=A0ABW1VT86_9GAMM|nr:MULTISPECIES: tRNA pseudouridine(13) synthase TruD [unclassified Tatumella]MBS0877021.1 tRNA pseudouridine(13) synthase TruD [Tatumella sp. JGM82]MBS0890842.1 tRNA pseudouridine(13) synthase TruD [Tatumella sp. JGM94]MBS0895290.1 tRNA pseudouridine(13) synthase TruD [Tatumella sp. JGM130]MBS0901913.1 tRNA pseudouridine(13) synthase TruD [Tatumella sp. JGM100]
MKINELRYLHGEPQLTGMIKTVADDFRVTEDLGYQPDGEGEQLLVRLRKTGCNTRFVAEALARYLKIPAREVSFAGMKDRHAVTEQTFCLRLPGKEMPDMRGFTVEGCEILQVTRHKRKIRTGALAGNAFSLIIRQVSDRQMAEQRLALIAGSGAVNYFGEQRFGRNGHNLTMAGQWARGEITIRDRSKRSLLLSAARSAIFNQVTSARLTAQGDLKTVMPGDCVQLTGRGSWFVANDEELPDVRLRVAQDQLRLTAPLAGRGNAGPQGDALLFEQQILEQYPELCALLVKEKTDAARRAMLVVPKNMHWEWLDNSTLRLDFWLPAGSFATSVVRELLQQGGEFEDIAE